jgi:hypothetical protein
VGIVRNLNPVSVTLGLLLVAGIYLGWKFVPVYWQAQKVDTALAKVRFEASKVVLTEHDPREARLLERLYDDIVSLGVDPTYLQVEFSPDYSSVHARYRAIVRHPFNKTTELEFHRSVEIPRDRL